jgi:dolichol kinase
MIDFRKIWHITPLFIEYSLIIQNFDALQAIFYLKYLLFFVIGMDYLRLQSSTINKIFIYNKLLKPDEYYQISASTYYFISVYINLFLGTLYPNFTLFYLIGMVSLAIGDPAAYFVGTTFPYIKLYNGKTITGMLGCFTSCLLFNYTTIYLCQIYRNDLLIYYNLLSGHQYFCIACLGALTSSITELTSGKYDNLTIAPFTALSMHISTTIILYVQQ